jgi:hypothetical protein
MLMGAGALAQPPRKAAADARTVRLAVEAIFILQHITPGHHEKGAG